MLIVCPNCATSYKVEEASLGAQGRTVRCARCRVTWFAEATPAVALEPAMASEAAETVAAPNDAAAGEIVPPSEGTALVVLPPPELPEAETVDAESPPLVPSAAGDIEEPAPSEDIETVAKRQAQIVRPPPPPRARRPRLAFYIPVLLAIIVAAMAGRTQIVRHVPQAASLFAAIGLPVNLRGLEFRDVAITNEMDKDTSVMVVRGNIANITDHKVQVPRMRFAVRNTANVEVYAWTALPEKTTLGVGESIAFRSQLTSPPQDAKTVAVRFANRHDREASH
ncbi:MAG: MJ0042-type zinc finger domain-containing protein [Variibacter sp.]